MGVKRNVHTGKKDTIGRGVKVSDQVAANTPTAPPPPADTDDPGPIDLTVAEWEQVWEVVQDTSKMAARKFGGVDADEVAGQAMLGAGSLRNRGELFNDPDAMRSYMYVVCRNAAWGMWARRNSGVESGRLSRARAQLARLSEGKRLDNDEIAALASTITVNGSHLPDGWHLWQSDSTDFADTDHLGRPVRSAEDEALDNIEPGNVSAGLMERLHPDSSAWDVTAGIYDAPTASAGIVSENTAIKVRKMMAAVGGIEEAIAAWKRVDITEEQEQALFAPWGTLKPPPHKSPHFWPRWIPPTATDQERIVAALDRVRDHSTTAPEKAWNSALSDATWIIQRADPRNAKPKSKLA